MRGSSTALWLAAPLLFPLKSQGDGALLDAFRKLPEAKQTALLKETESAVKELETGLGQLVEKLLARDEAPKGLPELWKGPAWYEPKVYAPGLPIARKEMDEDDPKTHEARRRFLNGKISYPLEGRFRYLPGQNKIVRLHKKEPAILAMAEMLEGYPPGASLAREVILQVLDDQDGLDAVADYYSHTYTDRDGNVFPGITIYDVWNSGFEIEMPDVDAIPFARHILKDDSYRSPIPDGPERNRLYQEIGGHFRDWRRYWLLREAAASWFFDWEPAVSPFVGPLRERLQFLIAWGAQDPFALRQFLKSHSDRESLIREADSLMAELGDQSWSAIEKRKTRLAEDRKAIRELVIEMLQKKLGAEKK